MNSKLWSSGRNTGSMQTAAAPRRTATPWMTSPCPPVTVVIQISVKDRVTTNTFKCQIFGSFPFISSSKPFTFMMHANKDIWTQMYVEMDLRSMGTWTWPLSRNKAIYFNHSDKNNNLRVSSGTVFFAEYCTVPFFGNGEITVPQSASIVLFIWFFVKMRGKNITGRNEKIKSCDFWSMAPKYVHFCNITYSVEKVLIII